ncbi:DUF2127 domain-containing protein [Acetanaerobacterium elongatum]|uniref:Predicted membrane protein n=1 Tax=Acetanaerobacterium elongatum TaxID=258515 RepID=A0A1H0ETA1_9FIRM|nr:DUF2127 domain-containing protein [Acetanaerobacterium elongatum]SDN85687.1 Predicted membrane protein [Acetanaerobacterium elongatum]
MKRYKIAAVLMIIHGGLMEIGGCLSLIPSLLNGSASAGSQYFSFIVPYLQENIALMTVMGGIYGIVRVTGAIGLLKNRMWGLVLSVINCVITMALMIFMLPAGIFDGILSCTSLILILTAYFGKKQIKE